MKIGGLKVKGYRKKIKLPLNKKVYIYKIDFDNFFFLPGNAFKAKII